MARKQEPLNRRRPATVGALVAGLCLVAAPRAWAGDRPSDDEMFGGGAPGAGGAGRAGGAGGAGGAGRAGGAGGASGVDVGVAGGASVSLLPATAKPATGSPAPAPPAAAESSRDDVLLGDPNAGTRLSRDVAPEDPLKIGGQLYLRALAQATQGQALEAVRFSAPALVDAYFDARPNDRVRGFVLGRISFDPTLPTTGTTATVAGVAVPSVPLLSGAQSTRGPNAFLDQMWLRFDIKRTVFVTAGRQHVKWGTGRFWTPTDYLHPQRRNPVAAFDARSGFTMLKMHVPWEARGWNFYGFGLVEGTPRLDGTGRYPAGSDGANTLGQVGGAARAELVLGTAELGLGAVAYRGQKPRFGGDLSFGIGDFDLYVDAGLRYGSDLPRRRYNPDDVAFTETDPQTGLSVFLPINVWTDRKYIPYRSTGIKPQVAAGGTYSMKYNDNDVFVLIGEYFYNSRGYDDPRVYPGLVLSNTFEFFYTGRHYAAIGAILAAPWSWNYTTFSLNTLGNLSDQSFMSILNYSVLVLTHLRFEAFGSINYGRTSGEFRLGVKELAVPGEGLETTRAFSLSPQAFSVGLGLRVGL